MSNRLKVAVLTTARSDYGAMQRIIALLPTVFSMDILVGGSHHLPSRGLTRREVESDWSGHEDVRLFNFEAMVDGMSAQTQVCTLAASQLLYVQHFSAHYYDAIIFLGDRWELFSATLPAFLSGIPLIHISGGEVTEGAIDDCIRHAHSKLAHVHFVANEQYARNLSLMGEEDWRIVVSGECGLDSLYTDDIADDVHILQQFGIDLNGGQDIALVTYHPSTLDLDTPVHAQIASLLDALRLFPDLWIIFTAPGMERDSDLIIAEIERFAAQRDNCHFVSHFGRKNYLAVLRKSALVLGNSSSGIVEAASFGVPAVNVGDRQKNRMCAESVQHPGYDVGEIASAIATALTPEFRLFSKGCTNPYDPCRDGRNSERIVYAVQQALSAISPSKLKTKKFDNVVHRHEWNSLIKDFK